MVLWILSSWTIRYHGGDHTDEDDDVDVDDLDGHLFLRYDDGTVLPSSSMPLAVAAFTVLWFGRLVWLFVSINCEERNVSLSRKSNNKNNKHQPTNTTSFVSFIVRPGSK
jgi:hypothetical protein